jgi:hypothetical protein
MGSYRRGKIAKKIDSLSCGAPRQGDPRTAVAVVVNKKLIAYALGLNHVSFRTKRSQTDDLPNDPVARDFDRFESAAP